MKFKKVLAVSLSICMIALCFTGCLGNKKTIKIGVFQPVTGPNGGGGFQEVLGIRFANKLYNTIKINGEEYVIKLDEVDNESDKTKAVRAANKLVADNVVAVVGSYGSGVSIAAGEFFEEAQIPAMGCSCTNPQVTFGKEYYFRTCFLDPFQGTVAANYAKSHNYNNVAIITQIGDDYSEGLGLFFKNACNSIGINVVSEQRFKEDEQDFRAILEEIKKASPDFIYAPSSIAHAPLILQQARGLGIDCPIGAGDTWENETIIENAHGSAEGIVLTTFYDEDPDASTEEGKKFLNGFKPYLKENNQKETVAAVSALGYDAYLAIYKAIEKAQSLEGPDIKEALKTLSFEGVTGAISFDENGDAKKNEAYIKTVENGKFKFLEIAKIG